FAPEQARAKPLDGRADIYSLGVSLFRAATGRLPFEGDDWYEIARQHVEDNPPNPRSINPAISPGFERVILRCLAKHPDDRPATGEQLADELSAVLANPGAAAATRSAYLSPSDTPTLVTPLELVRSTRAWKRVAPMMVVVVALGAAAIALATRRPAQGGLPATTLDSLATESGALVVSPPGTPSADSTRQADSASRADSGAA